MNYSVFSVDELDVLSEITKETELANEKFASEVIDPQLREFDKIACTCAALGKNACVCHIKLGG